jgi:hypothetical protein
MQVITSIPAKTPQHLALAKPAALSATFSPSPGGGVLRWFCELHRLSKNYDRWAVAKPPVEPGDADITLPKRALTFAPIKRKMECSVCGKDADATFHPTCGCKAGFRPKREVAAEAIRANPSKSNRMIAEEIGADEKTVRYARAAVADQSAPHTVTGRDGKTYGARCSTPRPIPAVSEPTPVERVRALCENLRSALREFSPDERENVLSEAGIIVVGAL